MSEPVQVGPRVVRSFLRRHGIPPIFRPDFMGQPDQSDCFCIEGAPERFRDLPILTETKHFRLTSTPFPKTDGQIIIVPKQHLQTFADVPLAWTRELEGLIAIGSRFQKDVYGKSTCLREQGSSERQSVHHAHLHLLPVGLPVQLPRGQGAKTARSWFAVSRFHMREGGYYFVRFGGTQQVMSDTGDATTAAELAVCDALPAMWDAEKKEPTSDRSPNGLASMHEMIRRWNTWKVSGPNGSFPGTPLRYPLGGFAGLPFGKTIGL